MYSFLEKNKLLHNKQFGFRTKHFTSHALLSLTETIKNFLDQKKKVAGIFIDLDFDTINHSILCDKLNYYGFEVKPNDLIRSFLIGNNTFLSMDVIPPDWIFRVECCKVQHWDRPSFSYT